MKCDYNLKEPLSILIYFKMSFIPLIAIFSRYSVSHDPSEIFFRNVLLTFLIITNVENIKCCLIYLWKTIFFRIL